MRGESTGDSSCLREGDITEVRNRLWLISWINNLHRYYNQLTHWLSTLNNLWKSIIRKEQDKRWTLDFVNMVRGEGACKVQHEVTSSAQGSREDNPKNTRDDAKTKK